VAFQRIKRVYKEDLERLFTRACSDVARDYSFKLKEGGFKLDIMKNFFITVVGYRNRLSGEVVDTPSLAVFKVQLDTGLNNLI